MFAEIISFICTGVFAGAALYVSLVEHPARLACSTDVALAEWRPSYKRAAVMQVILAIVGVGSAIGAYMYGRGTSVLVAGIVLATVVPWTLIIIMPTNRQLLDPARMSSTPDTDLLLKKWGRLHTIRTVASLLALAILAGNILGYL
jgi:anthrone oxygenase-like protein